MSIYPVKLVEWYPIGDDKYFGDIIESYRCLACMRKPRYSKAWGHHSVPFGYGDVWCSFKCLQSNKIGKLDKRQKRALNRHISTVIERDIKNLDDIWNKLNDNFNGN